MSPCTAEVCAGGPHRARGRWFGVAGWGGRRGEQLGHVPSWGGYIEPRVREKAASSWVGPVIPRGKGWKLELSTLGELFRHGLDVARALAAGREQLG